MKYILMCDNNLITHVSISKIPTLKENIIYTICYPVDLSDMSPVDELHLPDDDVITIIRTALYYSCKKIIKPVQSITARVSIIEHTHTHTHNIVYNISNKLFSLIFF